VSNAAVLLDYAFLIPHVISGVFSLTLAVITGRRMGSTLIRLFSIVLWLEFSWTLLLLFELLSPSLEAKLFWDSLQYPVFMAAPVVFFMFARRANDRADFSKLKIALLLIPAMVFSIASFTDPVHKFVRVRPVIDSSVSFGELAYGFTVFDSLMFVYIYILLIYSILILLHSYPPALSASARRKYDLVIFGFFIRILAVVPAILDVRIFKLRDNTPIWFALGNFFIFAALFHYNLFNLIPIAKRVLVESLGDPIITYDADGYLLDSNRAFADLVRAPKRSLRGRKLQEILSGWAEATNVLLAEFDHSRRKEQNVAVPGVTEEKIYRITVTSISGVDEESGTELCKVAMFRDITELVAVEKQLQAWNSELEGRVEARLLDLEQEVSRRRAAEEGLQRVGSKIVKSQQEILVTLSEVVENRSPETANHVLRVGEYSRILATARGLSDDGIALIVDAAPLHDVGKIAVPDSILNKTGPLTDYEMAVMKTHTIVGYRILGSSERSIIRAAAVIALEHHEHWNGKGYPAGKAGESISLSGRIVCVCDVFDALATARSYKQPWEIPRIIDFFASESGKMFDPSLVEILFANADRFKEVAARFPDPTPDS
jgi:response regulator RpfG family c-di-GMP phosphodiesterase